MTVEEFKSAYKIPLVIVLDNIRSGHNVGSVFRTSDAYRVEKIYLCGITCQPPHSDITKTAIGATDSVDWEYQKDTMKCLSDLRQRGYELLAIEQTENSIDLEDLKPKKGDRIALVLGNEVKGVQQKVVDYCDQCIELQQFGTKHSLNVSVCAGISIYQISAKIRRN